MHRQETISLPTVAQKLGQLQAQLQQLSTVEQDAYPLTLSFTRRFVGEVLQDLTDLFPPDVRSTTEGGH